MYLEIVWAANVARNMVIVEASKCVVIRVTYCNTLQHTATPYNTCVAVNVSSFA